MFTDFDGPSEQSDLDFEIDFSNSKIPEPIQKDEPTTKNKYNYDFDKDTVEKYRIIRKMKVDPVTYEDLDDDIGFKFAWIWNPYKGERTQELDPNGPLYFDPDVLIKHFYNNRYKKLWVEQKQDTTGVYEGYYDDGVGAGEDFHIENRGFHPEWYLFRLPVIDCYLPTNANSQSITMGPKLTMEEIAEIDRLASMRADNYKKIYRRNRPSLVQMKMWYDQAISKDFIIQDREKLTKEQIIEYCGKKNRDAVEYLKMMAG